MSIVLEDAESCPGDVGEGFELRPLVLERPEETFHNGIVIAATCTTHRAGQVESFQSLLVVVAGVLRASITAMQQGVRVRLPQLNGVTKSRTDQWCAKLSVIAQPSTFRLNRSSTTAR